MRYVGFVLLMAFVASPLRVSAQAGEEAETSAPSLQEPAPSSEAGHEEGGLSPGLRKRTRKKWDPGTYDVPPPRPATQEPAWQLELDLEEMELRVKRARIGLIVSAGVLGCRNRGGGGSSEHERRFGDRRAIMRGGLGVAHLMRVH